jgi:NAD(P) transhydrogenase subunit alpha
MIETSTMINIETLTIFVLSCIVGYYAVSKVTPALHAPLMSVTNAVSSVIIVVALDAILLQSTRSEYLCLAAVFLTALNIVGGLELTKRMLAMFTGGKGKMR